MPETQLLEPPRRKDTLAVISGMATHTFKDPSGQEHIQTIKQWRTKDKRILYTGQDVIRITQPDGRISVTVDKISATTGDCDAMDIPAFEKDLARLQRDFDKLPSAVKQQLEVAHASDPSHIGQNPELERFGGIFDQKEFARKFKEWSPK